MNVTFTTPQAIFVSKLKVFTIDATSASSACAQSAKHEISGTEFCVIETANSGGSASSPAASNDASPTGGSPMNATIGAICGVLALVLLLGFLIFRALRSQQVKLNRTNTRGTATRSGAYTPQSGILSLWQDGDLLSVQVRADEIQDVRKIGSGAYGDVWLVRYRKSQHLASKRLRKSETNRGRTREFINEIKLVAKLEHPRIVGFVGAAWTIETDLQALFEFVEGGDLRAYLENPHALRSWCAEKVQIAIDIVEALVYVHSFSPPIVHRDLKSRNILLTADLEAKLTDFGAARYQSEDHTMTAGVGTARWLAPEVISGSTDYGPEADLFSFGAVLSELDSHMLPYDEIRYSNGNKLADVALLQLISTGQLRPSFRASCPPKIVALANSCLALNPVDRPTAAKVAYELRTFKKKMIVVL